MDCTDVILDCPSGRDCAIDCYYFIDFDRRRRLIDIDDKYEYKYPKQSHTRSLHAVYDCRSYYGCCGSTLNCPSNQACSIDCERGCKGLTINAETASSLHVFGCGHTASQNHCGDMLIHCPQNGPGGTPNTCQIEGDSTNYEIEDSLIYTEEGFNDLSFTNLSVVCYFYLHILLKIFSF